MSAKSVSALRAKTIENLQLAGLSERTQEAGPRPEGDRGACGSWLSITSSRRTRLANSNCGTIFCFSRMTSGSCR